MWPPTDENLSYLCLGATSLLIPNAQVNKGSSANKGIAKTCVIVNMVRKSWSRIVVVGCGLHYFVSARFSSFWVFPKFSTAERFKYQFFTALKNHTMARIVKKHNNFIFSLLVTKTCQMCFTSTAGYGIIVQVTIIWFILKSSLYDAYMRPCDY